MSRVCDAPWPHADAAVTPSNDDGITHNWPMRNAGPNSLLFARLFVVIDSLDKWLLVLAPITFACRSVNVIIGNWSSLAINQFFIVCIYYEPYYDSLGRTDLIEPGLKRDHRQTRLSRCVKLDVARRVDMCSTQVTASNLIRRRSAKWHLIITTQVIQDS